MAAPDEPRLEVELAGRGGQERSHRVVGGRQQAHGDPQSLGQVPRRLGERRAFPQHPRADEVEPDVAISESEPALPAQPAGELEGVRRLVADTPATLLVEKPRERIEHRVEVRGDVQPENLDVVADVDDRRDLLGPGSA